MTRRHLPGWHAGRPTWGAALIAGLGCALPLSLGLLSSHPGFFWASAGAFLAAQANPLKRFGMLRLLLLGLLGACCAGLGFRVAGKPLPSLGLFALCGFLLAWLQRFGSEAGKLAIGLAICLCLGQGQPGMGSLRHADAVSVLFLLGALWVALLAFILRGLNGFYLWPPMPRLLAVLRVLRRNARRLPEQRWRLHAVGCTLACGSAGLIIALAELPYGYWLSLPLLGCLQLQYQGNLLRNLQLSMLSLCSAAALILLGHQLQEPAQLVMLGLPLIVISRAFQAHHYGLFSLQLISCFMLLAESLSVDWAFAQPRLFNSLLGVVLALFCALLLYGLEQALRHRRTAAQPPHAE